MRERNFMHDIRALLVDGGITSCRYRLLPGPSGQLLVYLPKKAAIRLRELMGTRFGGVVTLKMVDCGVLFACQ